MPALIALSWAPVDRSSVIFTALAFGATAVTIIAVAQELQVSGVLATVVTGVYLGTRTEGMLQAAWLSGLYRRGKISDEIRRSISRTLDLRRTPRTRLSAGRAGRPPVPGDRMRRSEH
jgi:hypothetical protein